VVTSLLEGAQARNSLLLRLAHYRVRARWYLTALVLPLLPALLAVLVYGALEQVQSGSVPLPPPGPWLLRTVVFVPLLAETGWRGFAFPRLYRRTSLVTSSILVGLLWGIWLLPLFLLPGTPAFTLATRYSVPVLWLVGALVWTASLSVILGCLVSRAGGGLVVAMVGHATALAGLLGFVVPLALAGLWWVLVVYLVSLLGLSAVVWLLLRPRRAVATSPG
jgi:membrane protease YdiL (CAAX protease family)